MKLKFKLLVAGFSLFILACNNDNNNIINQNPVSYRPHMFYSMDQDLNMLDARNPAHPLIHTYRLNLSSGSYDFIGSYDSSNVPVSQFPFTLLNKWPRDISDPVEVPPVISTCLSDLFDFGFLEWNSTQDSAYKIASPGFQKYYFKGSFCSVPMNQPIFGGVFGADMYPKKLDATLNFLDEGFLDPNPLPNFQAIQSNYFFDFNANTFYCYQTGFGYFEYIPYTQSDYMDKLIEKPNGNMNSNPIDFKKADAAFVSNGMSFDPVHKIYFLDYDDMKYVQVNRLLSAISRTQSDSGRFELVTTTWQPISDIISTWPQ